MMPRTPALALVLSLLAALADAAQSPRLDDLESEWTAEASRVDEAHEEYGEVAAAQQQSLVRLESARAALDAALADPQADVARLEQLEAALTTARDEAINTAEDAAHVRRRIYDALHRLAEIEQVVADVRDRPLVEDSGIAGTWNARWDSSGDFGILRLETNANMVSGTYRTTRGNAGSVQGTIAGEELRLAIFSATEGKVGDLIARLDQSRREGEGTWQRLNLSDSRGASGAVRLRRLDDSEAFDAVSSLP